MRVLVELRRPSLAAQVARGGYGPRRQRAYVSSLAGEVRALRSALEAKGVRLRRPVLFARVWNGFAATVDSGDLPQLRALGLRAEPVRRFYGAGTGVADAHRQARGRAPAVALLDSSGPHGSSTAQVLAQALGSRAGGILRIPVAASRRDPATGART